MELSARDAYLSIFDGLPSMMWRAGLDAKADYFNQSWLEFTGRSLEQELGNGWVDGVHPQDVERVLQVYLEAFERRQPFEMEFRLRHHSGEYRWVLNSGRPIYYGPNDFTGYVGTCLDITERKNAAEAIRDSEKLLTTAAMVAPIVFFKIDQTGVIRFSLGQSLARRLENTETVGRSIYEVYGHFPQVIDAYTRALAGVTVTCVVETNGLIYEVTYSPLHDANGEVTSVAGVASDVTRHRQVEEALRKSEAHFRTIFNDTVLGIKVIDLQGRIVDSNPAFQTMLGYSADELHKMTFADLTHPEDTSGVRKKLEALTAGKIDHFYLEKRYLRKDGQVLWGTLAMSLFRDADGKPLYGIGMVENITAQKQAEVELAEMQRRLADGVEIERLQLAQELHDGPLQELQAMSYQIAFLESMIENAEGQAEIQALQEELKKISQSIRAICGELRPPALTPFGLERAIRSHAEQFHEQHPELHLHLNLTNDGKALPERVRLALFRIYQHSITNILRHAQAKNVRIDFRFDDEHIELSIEDDGQGFHVPKRWIELVREGHYGLVGSIERAESIGGKMEIRSDPGKGTRTHVIVPRREEDQVTLKEQRYKLGLLSR